MVAKKKDPKKITRKRKDETKAPSEETKTLKSETKVEPPSLRVVDNIGNKILVRDANAGVRRCEAILLELSPSGKHVRASIGTCTAMWYRVHPTIFDRFGDNEIVEVLGVLENPAKAGYNTRIFSVRSSLIWEGEGRISGMIEAAVHDKPNETDFLLAAEESSKIWLTEDGAHELVSRLAGLLKKKGEKP